jgi:TolA-binding protein
MALQKTGAVTGLRPFTKPEMGKIFFHPSLLAAFLFGFSSCTSNSPQNQYVLAEKLWSDGKYEAAVVEFERVARKVPDSELGLQALYRAAMTEAYFLSQYGEAVRKFRTYAEKREGHESAWEAEKQIGELLFAKLGQDEQAIQHYQQLIKDKPSAAEVPEFLFRIGRSQFFLWRFSEAMETYRKLIKRSPTSEWGERAMYEIGVTLYTRNKQSEEGFQEAIDAHQAFLKKYPNSKWAPEARFGIAACLEEMDQLDAAYHAFEALKTTYPSPQVIQIKLARIKERKAQRSH